MKPLFPAVTDGQRLASPLDDLRRYLDRHRHRVTEPVRPDHHRPERRRDAELTPRRRP